MSGSLEREGLPDSARIDLRLDVKVPMRDGAHLSSIIYLPRDRPLPAPSICAMTPYSADGWHVFGVYFAARGLPFVIADVRGRGNSEGDFLPHRQEASDGCDLVEWLAKQPFCNGQVGMYGASYMGQVQWATITEKPPHLNTIVPTAAPYLGVDVPMRNNIFYSFNLRWAILTGGRTLQTKIAGDDQWWSAVLRRWHRSGRRFRALDAECGNPSAHFQAELNHPEPDAYWDAQNPASEDYARLQIPILTITGAYDDEQSGALEHYRRHHRSAAGTASARHYLLIGPWDHAGTQWPTAQFGGFEFESSSVIDMRALHVDWYRWTLMAGPPPPLLKKPVTYYMTGAGEWRYAQSLAAISGRENVYYLASRGGANDLYTAGSLTLHPSEGPPDSYTYDPRISDGPELEAEIAAQGRWLVDQGVAHALSGRLLVYHTDPLPEPLEIAGFFKLSAWIAIDCPDTDLYVSIHEIDARGGSLRLSTDALRARYRLGLRTPRLVDSTEPLKYSFEQFTFVARRVQRGCRLRLIIAPMGRLIDAIFNQKNFNGGGIVAEESCADGRPVTVSLFHDKARPSVLHVPLAGA